MPHTVEHALRGCDCQRADTHNCVICEKRLDSERKARRHMWRAALSTAARTPTSRSERSVAEVPGAVDKTRAAATKRREPAAPFKLTISLDRERFRVLN